MKLYVLKYLFTNPQCDKEERIIYYTRFKEALDKYEELQDKWFASDVKIYKARYSEQDNISDIANELI